MENEFTSVLLFISITFTLTRATSQKKYYQMALFCINWNEVTEDDKCQVCVDIPPPPFHLGGGGGYGHT